MKLEIALPTKSDPSVPGWMPEDTLEARAQSLATVNAIADTVYRFLDLQTLVEKAVDVIVKYVPVTSVALFTLDRTGEWLDLVAWRGFNEATLQVGSRLPITASLTGLTVRQQIVIATYDIAHSESLEPRVKAALLAQGLTGCISVPLLSESRAVGAANLIFGETHRLTPLESDTLLAVGKTIGLAIANAQHVNRIETEIAERRKVESELRTYKDHLEEMVAARVVDLKLANAQLAVAQARAEAANQAKTTFLSNVSHEVRTPLNVIMGFTGSMLHDSPIYGGEALPELYRKDIQIVMDNGARISHLINDLLDLSKIEAGCLELHRAPLDLPELLAEVVADSIGLVRGKPIDIIQVFPKILPSVWADRVRTRQIVLNLMSNAIKFTSAGHVTLDARNEGNVIRVSVTDTGIGIPGAALSRLFERYQQIDSEMGRRGGGTGLGLHISRQLVEMHGGEMTVSSTPGAGSAFSFTLPLVSAMEQHS